MSNRDSNGRFCKSEPRAFKVGDEVECTKGSGPDWRPGDRATLTGQDPDGDWMGLVHRTGYETWVHERHKYVRGEWHNACRLITPAPQPKAEEGKRLTTVDLVERFTTELGEALGERTPWSDMVARVATLKAEVEVLKQAEELAKLTALTYERRAEAAEAKLDDIKALLRAMNLLAQTPGEEPSFQDAMWHIVEN